jgi:ClpP class serine protease
MSTFQSLLDNIKDGDQHKIARTESIKKIESLTQRPLIVYAANTRRGGFNVPNTIDDSDITGFSDLIEGIDSKEIDIFLHSPGGSAESTERIVNLLRENFPHIRFLIPNAAYSAATMLALCGDEILMDERSTLGPIDPQIIITTPQGVTSAPVQDILDGFERIRQILKEDPGVLGAYLTNAPEIRFAYF